MLRGRQSGMSGAAAAAAAATASASASASAVAGAGVTGTARHRLAQIYGPRTAFTTLCAVLAGGAAAPTATDMRVPPPTQLRVFLRECSPAVPGNRQPVNLESPPLDAVAASKLPAGGKSPALTKAFTQSNTAACLLAVSVSKNVESQSPPGPAVVTLNLAVSRKSLAVVKAPAKPKEADSLAPTNESLQPASGNREEGNPQSLALTNAGAPPKATGSLGATTLFDTDTHLTNKSLTPAASANMEEANPQSSPMDGVVTSEVPASGKLLTEPAADVNMIASKLAKLLSSEKWSGTATSSATTEKSRTKRHTALPKLHPPFRPADELPPHRSRMLSLKLHELVKLMEPTAEAYRQLAHFRKKVDLAFLRGLGPEFHTRLFGSAATDLWLGTKSDVDLCLVPSGSFKNGTPNEPSIFCVRNALIKGGFVVRETVTRAAVPIVKFVDPETTISSDVNINNVLGIRNTQLIQTYVTFDKRVKPFLNLVKLFAKRRDISNPATQLTPSSYGHVMMALNYLQTRAAPILPSLQESSRLTPRSMIPLTEGDYHMGMRRKSGEKAHLLVKRVIDGTFTTDITDMQFQIAQAWSGAEDVADLLLGYFRHYGHVFDFDTEAMSVRLGRRARKEELDFLGDVIAIEDPFLLWKNLTYSSTRATRLLLLSEYRRAADILANCSDVDDAIASVFESKLASRKLEKRPTNRQKSPPQDVHIEPIPRQQWPPYCAMLSFVETLDNSSKGTS